MSLTKKIIESVDEANLDEAAGSVWIAQLNNVFDGVSLLSVGASQSGAIRAVKQKYAKIHAEHSDMMGNVPHPRADWAELAAAFDGVAFHMPLGSVAEIRVKQGSGGITIGMSGKD